MPCFDAFASLKDKVLDSTLVQSQLGFI